MIPRIVALLFLTCTCAFGQEVSYNTSTSVLTIPSVQVGSATYINVALLNTGNFTFTLQGATAGSVAGTPLATYNLGSGVLTIPAVKVGSTTYSAQLQNIGNFTFTLLAANVAQTFIYYSKTAQSVQGTATLVNGTLTMDGLTLTGFVFGGSASDASGTLHSWASPWNNFNQPVVEAMLFCGADGKLRYVLIRSAADDPARITRTGDKVVDAIHSAPQYQGMAIYRDCSGFVVNAWNNNLPASDYNLWPDGFTSYSYSTVASQLNGAAVYFQQGPPTNQHNYLAITWAGYSPFEVWQ